jgi:hypothetical protein
MKTNFWGVLISPCFPCFFHKFTEKKNGNRQSSSEYAKEVLQQAEEEEKKRHLIRIQEYLKPKNMRFLSDYSN